MKQGNNPSRVNSRRNSAAERLELQLDKGTKTNKQNIEVKLEESDIIRIKKELEVLYSRITTKEVAASKRTKKYRGAGNSRINYKN